MAIFGISHKDSELVFSFAPNETPPSGGVCVMFCAVRTTIRIAWLIAGTLLVARLAKAVIGYILWYGFDTTFWLPGRVFVFVPYLNAAALLAASFAIVVSCSVLIERRLASGESNRAKAATRN